MVPDVAADGQTPGVNGLDKLGGVRPTDQVQAMRVKASRKRLLVCLACSGECRIRPPFGEPRGMYTVRIRKEQDQGYC